MRYLISFFLCILALPAFAGTPAGTISTVEGWAYAERSGKRVRLRHGDDIQLHDRIETRKESRLSIDFHDGSQLTVGPVSHAVIDHFVYDANAGVADSTVNITKGVFRYLSSNLPKRKAKITTPVSTIGIRGTDLFGEVKNSGETLVGLVECCVDLSSDVGTVALDVPGTFSKVTARNAKPTKPIVCDVHWLDGTAKALGMSKEELGYDE